MSSLKALQLQREFDALATRTKRPTLIMQWTIDPNSGRPVAAWTVCEQAAAPAVLLEPALA